MAMIVIPRRVPWRRQPARGQARLAPAYADAAFAALPGEPAPVIAADQGMTYPAEVPGDLFSGSLTVSQLGRGTLIDASNTYRFKRAGSANDAYIEVPDGSDYTWIIDVWAESYSGTNSAIFRCAGGGGSNFILSPSAGIWVRHNGSDFTATGGRPSAPTRLSIVVTVKSAGFVKAWVNGIKRLDSATATATGNFSGVNGVNIWGANGTERVYGSHNIIALLYRTVSDAEGEALSLEPRRVFAPRTQRIFILSGGGLTLTVADAAHGHIADTPALTQAHVLAMQGADHPHTAESPNLTQQNTISPQDALHGHTADSPSLTQANVLTVNDANHTQLAEVLNLVQANTLTVADTAHGHLIESPSLIQAHTLVADDATHGHTADGVVLQVAGALIVQDTSHAHAAETPGLIQAHTLIVQDSTHGHTVESPTLGFGVQLAVDGTVHLHSAEQPVLTANVILAVQEALHAHGVDAPSLTQANTLIVSDALHSLIVDALSLILPSAVAMGPGRTILIKAQHRFIIIAPSNRFIVLSKQ